MRDARVRSALLRAIPVLSIVSVGYVLFVPGAVPAVLTARYDVGYTAYGLLTSVPLLSIVLVQAPSGHLTARYSTTRVLLAATALHVVLALAIDLAGGFLAVLAFRAVWGLAAGTVLTVGAAHVARLYRGAAATRQQGLYGGALTLGGAVAFLTTPPLLAAGIPLGLHAPGAVLGVPAVAACWLVRGATPPDDGSTGGDRSVGLRRTLAHSVVAVAALCYVASLGSYVTLSTFITAYFDARGITGPLNAVVLLVATTGRAAGGIAVARWRIPDWSLVAATAVLAVGGFLALAVGSGPGVALVLPPVAMVAVSAPFGAIYRLAGAAPVHDGAALAVVIGAGNLAALVLPAVTGAIRDATGGYAGGFLVLGCVNGAAVVGVLWLQWAGAGRG
jgi:predicted MFS family arabinose efflux permease